ncbi:TMhelix containing protein [Vibrio phage 2.275.O._10N.286.54.E11]|nr:TMhelix containing protein [Vibrio phage 2.275.O._10N.286.54.E11]
MDIASIYAGGIIPCIILFSIIIVKLKSKNMDNYLDYVYGCGAILTWPISAVIISYLIITKVK